MSDIQNLYIDLDLKENLLVTVNCKQFDNLNLIFNIWNSGLQVDLSNYRCRLKALKQDQIPLIQNTDISINNNEVTVIADEQLTTSSGVVLTELQFIDKTTGEKKSTFNLNIKVIASVLEVDRTISVATITLLQELDNKLDEIEDIGDVLDKAILVKADLENEIITTNTLKTNLDGSISTANTTKVSLETLNTTANNTKIGLDTSNTNANNSKTDLETATTNAETKKQEVVAECVVADQKISTMQSFGDVTQLTQNVTALKTEVEIARNGEVSLDARLDKSDSLVASHTTSLSEIKQNVTYGCELINSTNIVTTSGASTKIPFNTNIRDLKGMHSTTINNTRINILKSGVYNISGTVAWEGNATGNRNVAIKVNDSYYIAVNIVNSSGSGGMFMPFVGQGHLNVGDYVEISCMQISGVSLSIQGDGVYSPKISIQRVGD